MIRQRSFSWRKAFLWSCIALIALASLMLALLGVSSMAAGLRHPNEPGRITPIAAGVGLCLAALLFFLKGTKAVSSALSEKTPSCR